MTSRLAIMSVCDFFVVDFLIRCNILLKALDSKFSSSCMSTSSPSCLPPSKKEEKKKASRLAPWLVHVVVPPSPPSSYSVSHFPSCACSEAREYKSWDINQAPINNGRTSSYISSGLTDNKTSNEQRLELIYGLVKTHGELGSFFSRARTRGRGRLTRFAGRCAHLYGLRFRETDRF